MIHSCTVQRHQLGGCRWPGLLSRTAFCRPCRVVLVHYRSCWATRENWLCARLLPMAVSIYPVVCVHSCCLLGTQHCCLWPNSRGLSSACPPTPTTPCSLPPAHPLISNTRDIAVAVKNYLKNQQ